MIVSWFFPRDMIDDTRVIFSDRLWSYTGKQSEEKVNFWKVKAFTRCDIFCYITVPIATGQTGLFLMKKVPISNFK